MISVTNLLQEQCGMAVCAAAEGFQRKSVLITAVPGGTGEPTAPTSC